MELTVRDWMVIIGAGLILAVLVDAARRVIRQRRSEVRLNAKINRRGADTDDDDFNLLSELPTGGARIVRREDLAPPDIDTSTADGVGHADPENEPLDLNPEDMFSRAGGDHGSDSDQSVALGAANHQGGADFAHFKDDEALSPSFSPSFSALDEDDLLDRPSTGAASVAGTQGHEKEAARDLVAESPETLDWLEQLAAPEPEVEPEARLPRGIDPHVFVLHVVARSEQGFSGADILHILLACDLRFGDMDFFHRHEHKAGRGPIQFSVANMMKPGVFDIDKMSGLYTRGLMFFVTLPGPEDMLKAFDYMYETAKTVGRNLDGDVLDETRSAVTRQGIDHMRQQIRELERRVAEQSRR